MAQEQAVSQQDPLLVQRDGHLLILTLNRPERLNALNRPLQAALNRQFLEADRDPTIRCIILTGTGRAFCSGADVEHLRNEGGKSIEQQLVKPPQFTARQCGIFTPTICAVNGVCAGAGLHFVADSDIVIASDSASFVDTHLNVGQVSALEPIGLIRRMPMSHVLRMVLLGKAERVSAQQALDYRLISEVTAPDNLLNRARELGQIVASVSPAAARASLQAIYDSLEMPLAEAYEKGHEALIRYREHPDAAEGVAAFLEKRPPRWQ